MAEVDYDALAGKYGGQDQAPQQDYDSLAKKFGGTDAEPARAVGRGQLRPKGADAEKPDFATDIVKSLPGAVPRAAAGLAGFPQSLADLVDRGMMKMYEKLGPSKTLEAIDRFFGVDQNDKRTIQERLGIPNVGDVVNQGYDEISKAITGAPVYRPQTGPGRIADLTAQTVVGSPGSIAQKATMGVSAGITGELARTITDNPIAIGVLQMLGASVASLPFILRSVPAENINAAIKDITPADLAKAQKLMDDARRMGTPITGAEAIAQTTGKNNLQDIQRVVEGSKESSAIIQPMMNARPEANRAAFGATADTIAPRAVNPAETPVKLQQTASDAIRTARQAGNAAAGPSYAAAAGQRIGSTEWNALAQDHAVQKALAAVKGDPIWGVTNEAEGSIRWLDAAKKWIDDELVGAKPAVSRIYQDANAKIKAAADAASPDYAQARSIVAQNRQNVVQPMENSPVGDIARTGAAPGAPRPSGEAMMKEQSGILMPQSPRALDPKTIGETLKTLNQQNPAAASQWTRQNIEAIFNEAAQKNVAGENQWGGAKFASQIAGNPAQRENLQALIEGTGGKRAWAGFERMLEVMEAQGKRLAPGSNTARDLRTSESLAAAGAGAPAIATASLKAGTVIYEWYQNFRFGKNTAEMARILTDPKSVELMQKLAREAPQTSKAAMLTAQILAAENVGAQTGSEDR